MATERERENVSWCIKVRERQRRVPDENEDEEHLFLLGAFEEFSF